MTQSRNRNRLPSRDADQSYSEETKNGIDPNQSGFKRWENELGRGQWPKPEWKCSICCRWQWSKALGEASNCTLDDDEMKMTMKWSWRWNEDDDEMKMTMKWRWHCGNHAKWTGPVLLTFAPAHQSWEMVGETVLFVSQNDVTKLISVLIAWCECGSTC